MSIPELCNAMGLLRPRCAPLSPVATFRLIGNAIATPHAMLCLLNTVGQLPDVCWTGTPTELIHNALQNRLSASKQEVLVDTILGKIEMTVSPTLQWSDPQLAFSMWHIPFGPEYCKFHVHPGLPVAWLIRFMYPQAVGNAITWRPSSHPDIQVPLTADDMSGYSSTKFDGIFGNFQVREVDCHTQSKPFIVVCSGAGHFVLVRSPNKQIESLRHDLSGLVPQAMQPCNLWGHRLEPTSFCPDLVFMRLPLRDTPEPSMVDDLRWIPQHVGWYVEAMDYALHHYVHFCLEVGVVAFAESVGWQMSWIPSPGSHQPMPRVAFQPILGRPCISSQNFVTFCTTLIAQALLPRDVCDSDAIRVTIKRWDSWTPVHNWPRITKVHAVVDRWSRASKHTGSMSQMRAIYRGQRLSHEEHLYVHTCQHPMKPAQ